MKKVILAGNGITAEILFAHLQSDARYDVACLTADDDFVAPSHPSGLETVPLTSIAASFPAEDFGVIMAMGYKALNSHRQSMFDRLKVAGFSIETYIHPNASVSDFAAVGEGAIVLPQAVVEPYARVGSNTVLWANTVVAHHSVIGDHCWVASGSVIAGRARLGVRNFVGVNATVVDGVTVGDDCFIGAGALISRDIAEGTVHLARSAEQVRFTSKQYSQYFGV